MKGSLFLGAWMNKCRKIRSRVLLPCTGCEDCCRRRLKHSMCEQSSTPTDVPKGHLVVYVGERYKRFVIKISLLQHPLFRALLDQAQDEYDFTIASKLCIPCSESLFLDVVRCATSSQDRWRNAWFGSVRFILMESQIH